MTHDLILVQAPTYLIQSITNLNFMHIHFHVMQTYPYQFKLALIERKELHVTPCENKKTQLKEVEKTLCDVLIKIQFFLLFLLKYKFYFSLLTNLNHKFIIKSVACDKKNLKFTCRQIH
jgi:hypothetical protein